jgi:energy-coupling factor transporter transmembrane protein EcfT
MEDTFIKIEQMAAHAKEYVNNRIAEVKLSSAEKTSKLLAIIIAIAVSMLVFIFFIAFASTALAFALAKWTGEFYWGFLIVAGIYFLLGMLVWILKEKLLRFPIMNAMLQQLFKADTDNEEN